MRGLTRQVNKLVYKKLGIFNLSRDISRVIKGVHRRDITVLAITVVYITSAVLQLVSLLY